MKILFIIYYKFYEILQKEWYISLTRSLGVDIGRSKHLTLTIWSLNDISGDEITQVNSDDEKTKDEPDLPEDDSDSQFIDNGDGYLNDDEKPPDNGYLNDDDDDRNYILISLLTISNMKFTKGIRLKVII